MNNDIGASVSARSAALLRDETLGEWVHSFKGFFPSDDGKSREWHDHLPGHELAPKRTLATATGRRREVEALIVAAVSVRDARPANRAHQLVYAAWC